MTYITDTIGEISAQGVSAKRIILEGTAAETGIINLHFERSAGIVSELADATKSPSDSIPKSLKESTPREKMQGMADVALLERARELVEDLSDENPINVSASIVALGSVFFKLWSSAE